MSYGTLQLCFLAFPFLNLFTESLHLECWHATQGSLRLRVGMNWGFSRKQVMDLKLRSGLSRFTIMFTRSHVSRSSHGPAELCTTLIITIFTFSLSQPSSLTLPPFLLSLLSFALVVQTTHHVVDHPLFVALSHPHHRVHHRVPRPASQILPTTPQDPRSWWLLCTHQKQNSIWPRLCYLVASHQSCQNEPSPRAIRRVLRSRSWQSSLHCRSDARHFQSHHDNQLGEHQSDAGHAI